MMLRQCISPAAYACLVLRLPLAAGSGTSSPTPTFSSGLSASCSNGTKQAYALKYEPFFITGAQVPNGAGGTILAGGYYDINNQPILDMTDPGKRQFFSDSPDGMSLGPRSKKSGNFAGRIGRTAALSIASSARTASRRTVERGNSGDMSPARVTVFPCKGTLPPCRASRYDRQIT